MRDSIFVRRKRNKPTGEAADRYPSVCNRGTSIVCDVKADIVPLKFRAHVVRTVDVQHVAGTGIDRGERVSGKQKKKNRRESALCETENLFALWLTSVQAGQMGPPLSAVLAVPFIKNAWIEELLAFAGGSLCGVPQKNAVNRWFPGPSVKVRVAEPFESSWATPTIARPSQRAAFASQNLT